MMTRLIVFHAVFVDNGSQRLVRFLARRVVEFHIVEFGTTHDGLLGYIALTSWGRLAASPLLVPAPLDALGGSPQPQHDH
jgi:hypothetical protein